MNAVEGWYTNILPVRDSFRLELSSAEHINGLAHSQRRNSLITDKGCFDCVLLGG
jgi:hypothetical protein